MGSLWRIRDRATFAELRRRGHRVRRGPVTVTWLPATDGNPPRVAFAIGRRAGTAVVRNRLRRRLQAILREGSASLAPGAYLVGASADATELAFDELREAVLAAAAAAAGRSGAGGTEVRGAAPVGGRS